MNTSQTGVDLIIPDIFDDEDRIEAWFTLKNPGLNSNPQGLPGLNLGSNTGEEKEKIEKNRNLLFDALDLDADWVAFADQIHSSRVQLITEGGMYPNTDGLVTAVPGLALAIQVADCAAVLMADPVNRVAAAIHAGWRGAAGNIISNGVELMRRQGAKPDHIRAYVSPCISQKNFEVGTEVAEQFPDRFVDYESYEKPHVDLKVFIHHNLVEMGINERSIEMDQGCTYRDADRFYSYRREKEQSGRMLGIIRLIRQ